MGEIDEEQMNWAALKLLSFYHEKKAEQWAASYTVRDAVKSACDW